MITTNAKILGGIVISCACAPVNPKLAIIVGAKSEFGDGKNRIEEDEGEGTNTRKHSMSL